MSRAPTFAAAAAGYRNMWQSMSVTPQRAGVVDTAARRILTSKRRYQAVERTTGVPWFFIAILHMRESNNNFAGVLHNGQKIIGTGQKTTLVPAGRGPFATWEQSADDALRLKGLHAVPAWPVERIGYEAERFNGWGYTYRGINSPYLWAGSNHQQRGKFVADGKFDPNHTDTQLGAMTVLRRLTELDAEVAARVSGVPVQVPAPGAPPAPPARPGAKETKDVAEGGLIGLIFGAIALAFSWVLENPGLALAAVMVTGVLGYLAFRGISRWWKNRDQGVGHAPVAADPGTDVWPGEASQLEAPSLLDEIALEMTSEAGGAAQEPEEIAEEAAASGSDPLLAEIARLREEVASLKKTRAPRATARRKTAAKKGS